METTDSKRVACRCDTLWRGLALAAGFVSPGFLGETADARSAVPYPADLYDAAAYPGLRGIPELSGDYVHNCGNLMVHITNFGVIGSMPGERFRFSTAPSAQWPAGSDTEYLWVAGLWVGAIREGEPAVTTGAYDREFWPGRSELDRIYRTRELAPGGARAPSPNADDDADGRVDEDWLDGRDNDDDGKVDEDFAAISNQMFFTEYSDTDPDRRIAYPEHQPLGIRVQQTSLCWEDPLVDDVIAFDFTVIHEGAVPLYDVYVGFFADPDIGPRGEPQVAQDDMAGFWEGVRTERLGTSDRNLKLSIGYMWDDDGDDGQSEGYVGILFLGAQEQDAERRFVELRNYRAFSGNGTFEDGGDARTDEQRYQALAGTAPRSLPPANPTTGVRPPQATKKIDDYRFVVSAGPFSVLEPGDRLSFQAAIVLGAGFAGMLRNAAQAQLTFDGVFLDCDGDQRTGTDGAETAVCGPEFTGERFRIDPCNEACDAAPPNDPECWVTVPSEGCVWINSDCEWEIFTRQRTGVDGKECLIRWLISSAPPPPRLRAVTSEARVDLLFDNFSEVTPDLRIGAIDFESYRIWRAENWTRPLGTDIRSGPGNGLWILLAEYDLAGNGVGSDRGLEEIVYTPRIPSSVVEFYREWFEQHPLLQPPDVAGYTVAELDTAKALARGARYYRYTDPPLNRDGVVSGPCPPDGRCPPFVSANGSILSMRCNESGQCQESGPAPHSGGHYFYAVSATDHKLRFASTDDTVGTPIGPGLAGSPNSNFVYVNPTTRALPQTEYGAAKQEIYVVPNPATPQTLRDWALHPNDRDPSGVKVEFHHLPQARGMVRVYTLAGDLVIMLPFDARKGNGSLAWDLISRNGQEITSGVYLYVVEAPGLDRFVGKFVVVR